ncbi:MAG: imidazole glycerol phosphate synthase subunit HisF [Candidatus Hydrogenedentota bacterium]|nr:MAG: imidazole glycerol phosphate synthase subunit HisF [Candidatus Hydrogenedentota bacterium]
MKEGSVVEVPVRVIPCLDVDRGRVVKGVNFVDLVDAGDPVEQAHVYNEEGADELVFLDITASSDGREIIEEVVTQTAESVFIPLTVGGGIRSVEDFRRILLAGADKVSVNTAAVQNPALVDAAAKACGNQCVVVAIDARRDPALPSGFGVTIHGGRTRTERDAVEWAREVESRGAGEILLTSMDADGTCEGFDLEMIEAVSGTVSVPVIASGGAGKPEDFPAAVRAGAAAVLAASVFHFRKFSIREVKEAIRSAGFEVRPV